MAAFANVGSGSNDSVRRSTSRASSGSWSPCSKLSVNLRIRAIVSDPGWGTGACLCRVQEADYLGHAGQAPRQAALRLPSEAILSSKVPVDRLS